MLHRDAAGKHQETQLGDGFHKAERRGTYCAMHLERPVPKLRECLAPTGVDGAAINRINLYVSPPGSGAPMHFDARWIVVVQLSGSKLWQVGMGPAVSEPLCNVVADEAAGDAHHGGERLALPDGMHFVLLRPGDWLMLPWGTWHGTYSQGGSVSATLAFADGATPAFPPDFGAGGAARLREGRRLLC
jgi:ribosomal protein L16 Arg81 hydroxylase